ncbi:hypothetical protein D9M70_479350 [compost metagenome]
MHIVLAHALRHIGVVFILSGHHSHRTDTLAGTQADQHIAFFDLTAEAGQRTFVIAAKLERRIGQIGLANITHLVPADTGFTMLEAVASGAPVATSLLDGNLPDGRVFLQPQFLLKHRVATGIQTQLDKHTLGHIVSQRSTRVTLAVRWQSPQPLDEILVAEALVEGHKTHSLSGHKAVEPHL